MPAHNYLPALALGSSGTYYLLDAVNIFSFPEEGDAGIKLVIRAGEPFRVSIDYVGVKYYSPSDPLLVIASNESTEIYVYRVETSSWVITYVGGKLINPNVVFDYASTKFLILNESCILEYDPVTNTVGKAISLWRPASRAGDAAFILPDDGYVLYSPGGGLDMVWVINETTGSVEEASRLPEGVNPYTCVAYDPQQKTGYVIFGGTGNTYSIALSPKLTPKVSKITLSPTAYPVGLSWGGNYLWLISRGGSAYYINVTSGEATALLLQLPYYPLSEGNRLAYVSINGDSYLLHVRGDGTRDLWRFNVSIS